MARTSAPSSLGVVPLLAVGVKLLAFCARHAGTPPPRQKKTPPPVRKPVKTQREGLRPWPDSTEKGSPDAPGGLSWESSPYWRPPCSNGRGKPPAPLAEDSAQTSPRAFREQDAPRPQAHASAPPPDQPHGRRLVARLVPRLSRHDLGKPLGLGGACRDLHQRNAGNLTRHSQAPRRFLRLVRPQTLPSVTAAPHAASRQKRS